VAWLDEFWALELSNYTESRPNPRTQDRQVSIIHGFPSSPKLCDGGNLLPEDMHLHRKHSKGLKWLRNHTKALCSPVQMTDVGTIKAPS
jgi:hypothetical protein